MVTLLKSDAIQIARGDAPQEVLALATAAGRVAVDIETTGLDWETCAVATLQLGLPDGRYVVVTKPDPRPAVLLRLLAAPGVLKVFHHAMFDLRFLAHHWGAEPSNIACTKIASKLLNPGASSHSLKPLLQARLGVILEKTLQQSDWATEQLSEGQVNYAVGDVAHLIPLYEDLSRDLCRSGLIGLYRGCLQHIPTRVQLETRKYQDVFAY